MTRLYVLDVPENDGFLRVARDNPNHTVDRCGPYARISADGPIVIDRRATGARHAVWYSSVAALERSVITQQDKDALRIEPRACVDTAARPADRDGAL